MLLYPCQHQLDGAGLLVGDADPLGQLLLGEAEHDAPLPHPGPDVPVRVLDGRPTPAARVKPVVIVRRLPTCRETTARNRDLRPGGDRAGREREGRPRGAGAAARRAGAWEASPGRQGSPPGADPAPAGGEGEG